MCSSACIRYGSLIVSVTLPYFAVLVVSCTGLPGSHLHLLVNVLYCVYVKGKSLRDCLSSYYFLHHFGFVAKKYFTDLRTANTIHLFVALKRNFLVYSFFEQVKRRGIPQRLFDKCVATCLFAYDWNRHNGQKPV